MNKFSEIESDANENYNLIKDIFYFLDSSEYIDNIKITASIEQKRRFKKDEWWRDITLPARARDRDDKKEIPVYTVYHAHITWSKMCMSNRKIAKSGNFGISYEEIDNYWRDIHDIMGRLKKIGFSSYITFYQPNGVEMIIRVEKD